MKPSTAGAPRRRRLLGWIGGGLSAWLGGPSRAQEEPTLVVRHALSQGQNAKVLSYEQTVLQLLLDRTVASHGPYRLEASEVVSQNRAFLQIQAGEIDLISAMTSSARERQSIPVRVCLYRGLMGVRLPIALRSRVAELEAVRSNAEAQALRTGQVADWPDAQILAAAGWRLERLPKLATFPEMLRRQRVDLFALGATEVYPIVDALPDLRVLEHWLIAYPAAFYFFISPQRPELAQRLRKGWELVLADGSFLALFERTVGSQLARARLAERLWLRVPNPDLPAETPLHDSRLWHPLVRSRLHQAEGR